jgi:hypothetical protein
MAGPSEQQRLEESRRRVSVLLSIADAIGGGVDLGAVRGAALAPLSPIAERAATLFARLTLAHLETVALILAGLADDAALARLMASLGLPSQGDLSEALFGDLIGPTSDVPKSPGGGVG